MDRTKVLESTSNIFELASRFCLRFPFKGQIDAEDLWLLKPSDLKVIYLCLKEKLPEGTNDVFDDVSAPTVADKIVKLQIEIVLHIAGVKKAEALARKDAAEKKLHNDKIDSFIARKQDAELEDKSIEDLLKMKSE